MEEEAGSEHTPAPKRSLANVLKTIIGIIALLSIALLVGYFFTNHVVTISEKKTEVSSPTPTTTQTKTTEATPEQSAKSPIPTVSVSKKTVSSGLTNSSAFKLYTIQVPTGWTESRENDPNAGIDRLTLTKGEYSLIIYQASFGGGGCTYPGQPEQQFAQKFSDFVEIAAGAGGQYRRSWNKTGNSEGKIAYSICQKGSDASYGQPTQFGGITAYSPTTAGKSTLSEIDAMIASITKQ